MAKDKIHYAVKIALENDGWQVTDDPLVLFFDDDSVAIDLERVGKLCLVNWHNTL